LNGKTENTWTRKWKHLNTLPQEGLPTVYTFIADCASRECTQRARLWVRQGLWFSSSNCHNTSIFIMEPQAD